jgi:DNA-binding transcriptional LysR family regulator
VNLRGIDLNLLVVLDAVLGERHVTRAAERLGMSQPAVSSALDRCRQLFDDPLIERRNSSMRLTAKAESLQEPLRAALGNLGGLLFEDNSDIGSSSRVIRLIMSDYPAVVLLRRLLDLLRRRAPGLDLVVLPWRGGASAAEALRRGQADLAVSVLPAPDDDFRRTELFQETYRVAMRREHPAARDFDLDRWLAFPHVLVSARGHRHSPLDDLLIAMGKRRRIGVVVPSFMMATALLRGSDLIAMLPTRCIPQDEDLVSLEPPLPVEGFPLHLAWHRRSDGDAVVRHIAGLIPTLLS